MGIAHQPAGNAHPAGLTTHHVHQPPTAQFSLPQVLSRLANVPLFSRRPMQGNVSGRHPSPHRGSSVEFAEYRKYVAGDDLRRLDWRVFGRTDRFYVKEFEADTNLRCCFVLDTSGSMGFGSGGVTKIEFARKLAGSLGDLAVQQGDAVGVSCVANKVVRSLPPSRNPAHLPVMPGGCNPKRAPTVDSAQFRPRNGSLRLGYFGCLSEHAGVRPLIETVLASGVSATVEICGYGRLDDKLSRVASQDPRLKFHGLQTPDDCLAFGQSCDVLVNPRPATHGNENNFSSKLFDYALTGRAILTSRLSGAEDVLGPEAFYFDPQDFEPSLQQALLTVAATGRAELDRRGQAIQSRVTSQFSWNRQGLRLASFLQELCPTTPSPGPRVAALAA